MYIYNLQDRKLQVRAGKEHQNTGRVAIKPRGALSSAY